ncbi:hypothetical protein Tco_0512207 [Tanacetum coccineum]
MEKWKDIADMKCSLCKKCADSHDHLFFKCDFAKQVWNEMLKKTHKLGGRVVLRDIVEVILNERCENSIGMVVNKIVLAATVYTLWQERNQRIFRNEIRNVDAVCKIISEQVRNKLMTLKVKNSVNGVWIPVLQQFGLGKSVHLVFCKAQAVVFDDLLNQDWKESWIWHGYQMLSGDSSGRVTGQHAGYSFSLIHGIVSLGSRLTPDKSTRYSSELHDLWNQKDSNSTGTGVLSEVDCSEESPETTLGQHLPIEGHLSALRSLLKEHNGRGNVSPIHLSFDDVEDRTRVRTVVTGKEIGDTDLKRSFKEAVKTPLTRRIIEFAGTEFKMPVNIKLYDGTTDPEGHLSRFSFAANSRECPMPVWCRMFQQTLDGSARGWFSHKEASTDGWNSGINSQPNFQQEEHASKIQRK